MTTILLFLWSLLFGMILQLLIINLCTVILISKDNKIRFKWYSWLVSFLELNVSKMLCGVTQMIFVCKLQKNHLGNTPNPNIKQIYLLFISWCYEIYILYNCSKTHYGPQHVLWQVSFGCWVMWSISSWQKYYKSANASEARICMWIFHNGKCSRKIKICYQTDSENLLNTTLHCLFDPAL